MAETQSKRVYVADVLKKVLNNMLFCRSPNEGPKGPKGLKRPKGQLFFRPLCPLSPLGPFSSLCYLTRILSPTFKLRALSSFKLFIFRSSSNLTWNCFAIFQGLSPFLTV